MDLIEKAKKTWVTAAQFAKLIGSSRQAVYKAIFSERIQQSVVVRERQQRKRYFVNLYYGLYQWRANTTPASPDTKHIDIGKILLSYFL